MFQLERLKVIAETIDQIAEEIEAGNVDNIDELYKASNTVLVNSTALKHLIGLIKFSNSEVQQNDSL